MVEKVPILKTQRKMWASPGLSPGSGMTFFPRQAMPDTGMRVSQPEPSLFATRWGQYAVFSIMVGYRTTFVWIWKLNTLRFWDHLWHMLVPRGAGALRYVLDNHCRTSLRSGSGGLTERIKCRGSDSPHIIKGRGLIASCIKVSCIYCSIIMFLIVRMS